MPTDNTNPGNFANRSTEEVKNIASKGGQSSHSGGFANMDSDKQVFYFVLSWNWRLTHKFDLEGNCVPGRPGF